MKTILNWLMYIFLSIIASLVFLFVIIVLFSALVLVLYVIILVFVSKEFALEFLYTINNTIVWAYNEYPQAFHWVSLFSVIGILDHFKVYKQFRIK